MAICKLKGFKYSILSVLIMVSCLEEPNGLAYLSEIEKMKTMALEKGYNQNYAFIIDYSLHSGYERGFLIDLNMGTLRKGFLVAHGSGMGQKNGKPKGFSNQVGSNASSLGYAVLDGRDYSNWGINVKYWLKGLSETNSNLRERVVVLHSWEGIPDEMPYPRPIAQSFGCPTVSNKVMKFIDSLVQSQDNKKLLILCRN